jgi:ubiquinone biosynthesis protein COQ9
VKSHGYGHFGAYIAGMTGETDDPDAPGRDRLADEIAADAAFEGWTRTAIMQASDRMGLPAGEADRLFPGGPVEVLEFVSRRADQRTVEDMGRAGAPNLKVRERIRLGVRLRLESHGGEKEAARRALSLLALPLNAGLGFRLLYRTVDALWYAAGDNSVDFNFYTKRATLAGVFSTTLLYWLNDRSEGNEATWAFLDRRIDDVMRIEKLKARVREWQPGGRARARTGASSGR